MKTILSLLELFLDIVPSSSADITRALHQQLRQLFLKLPAMKWQECHCILFWFHFIHVAEMFYALSVVFLFGTAFVYFVPVWMFIIWRFIWISGV